MLFRYTIVFFSILFFLDQNVQMMCLRYKEPQGLWENALFYFKKGIKAQALGDNSKAILYYNAALYLEEVELHDSDSDEIYKRDSFNNLKKLCEEKIKLLKYKNNKENKKNIINGINYN